jgi:lysophospholipase L1-like esterase
MPITKKLLALFLLVLSAPAVAQELPFSEEIQAFKREDSLQAPPENAIVFVGSSSFNMWDDVNEYFPGYTIINRGFGGSSLPHVIEYADEIILPYKPRQVVIYCGENDLVDSTVTGEIVAHRFKKLFKIIRRDLRKTDIVFVSIKPSPSRQALIPKMKEANDLIKRFLDKKRRTSYVSIWDQMLDQNGAPRKELFLEDMLHMNKQGYQIWQKAIAPALEKALSRRQ